MRDRSGAGWSGELEQDDAAVLSDRYEWRDVLGSGGMGTVHAVFDEWLGREVAMKLVRRAVAEGASVRAIREAEITARLEHPAIVPVYDAGEAPDGRSFFTMRMVRGRSMRDALVAESPLLADRLALLRAFVTVCDAVAYAHSRGVIHRDLKPSNIMLGEFGEVQLVDWGLAHVADEPDPFVGAVGTTGYVSPEQARGATPRPTDDVFALGAVLRTILDGTSPVPEDLHAVVEAACAPTASKRYPTVEALAGDVQRYLDGRPVSARAYSSWALASRFVRVYRRGLALAAVAGIALAVVFSIAYGRVEAARERAVDAERGTRAALREQSDALAWALESNARAALDSGDLPEAEIFAVAALKRRESASARGVLMRVHAGIRPRSERAHVATECDRVFFGIESHLCVRGERASFWEAGDEVARWSVTMAVEDAAVGRSQVIVQGAGVAHLVDRGTGARVAVLTAPPRASGVLVDPAGTALAMRFGAQLVVHDALGGARTFTPCRDLPTHAMALGEASVAAACGDQLVIERLASGHRQFVSIPFGVEGRLPAFALGFEAGDGRIAIGGVGGEIAVVDLEDGSLSGPWPVTDRAIGGVDFLDDGVLASIDGGGAAWISAASGVRRLSLPQAVSRRTRAAAGRVHSSHGNERWTWTLPLDRRPFELTEPSGLSSAAFDPVTRWVFLARGDGRLSVRGLPDGERVRELPLSDAVVKRCSVSSDGSEVFAAVAGEPGGFRIETASWTTSVVQPLAMRRVLALTEQVVWAPYGDGPRVGGASPPFPQAIDLSGSPDRRGAVALGRRGEIYRLPGDVADPVARPFAAAVALANDGRIAIAFRDRVVVVDGGGESEWPVPAEPLDLAFSHDGALLAVGTREGAVLVYDPTGTLRARIDDAKDRIPWVEFGPDGRLASASWDGTLRFYEPAVLDLEVEELEQDALRTWRLSLAELSSGVRATASPTL